MKAKELEETIELAFQDVKRPEKSLRQFQLTDQKGMSGKINHKEWVKAGKERVDYRWQDIPDSELEECGCLLSHMQAEEFQYYLPAYMHYSVRYYQKPIWESDILGFTVFSLYPSSKDEDMYHYKVSQFSLLNGFQKRIIVEFLKFVAFKADYVQRPDAVKAIERYWKKELDSCNS